MLPADPWDGRISREAHLRVLLKVRASPSSSRNLSPILDELRAIKSPAELARHQSRHAIGGEAILEAMRSTAPGFAEYELDALAHSSSCARRPGRATAPSSPAGRTR